MTNVENVPEVRVVSAAREVHATPATIFELIADPSRHASWDGNENVASASEHQRVTRAGDVFRATLTTGAVRENHVVEFEEGRRIAWQPAEPGKEPPGHLWRWELEPLDAERTLVRHTYDWTALNDPNRFARARATTSERLMASVERLCALAEREASDPA
ncbi:SRPBCC family protein [Acidimicrobium ferrooxidans]|nr:SRPBCC family protein [Acidimicrobium ferrooxidans]